MSRTDGKVEVVVAEATVLYHDGESYDAGQTLRVSAAEAKVLEAAGSVKRAEGSRRGRG